MSATSAPATISFPHPAPLSYRLRLTATGRDETFSLGFDEPFFGADPTGSAPIGTSLVFTSQRPSIEGPASLLGPAFFAEGLIACGPTVPVHGFDTERRRWDVRVPAGTTSTLTFGLTPASASPWPDTDYDIEFIASRRLVTRTIGTLAADQAVIAKGPRTTGRRGVRLTLTSRPATRLAALRGATVRKGRTIRLAGTTLPRRRHKLVRLYALTGSRSAIFHLVKTVRTDGRGHFRTAIRAPGHSFQVMARTPASPLLYDSDYSCPLGFAVRAP